MGLEVIIGAVSAAASIVTGVMSLDMAKKAQREQQKANAERVEANKVANAQAKNESAGSRRRAIREARVRRAMIMQSSVNSGLGLGGSGTQGAVGVIGTNLGGNLAESAGKTKAIEGINARNQSAAQYEMRASDYNFQSQQIGAIGNIFSNALGAFGQGLTAKPKSIFDT